MNNLSEITLRKACAEDANALVSIYSYYVENTAITFEWEVPTVEEFKNRIIKISQKFPYIVAERVEEGKKKIVGYAYSSTYRTRAAYAWTTETSIYIDKEYRKLGIGKLLLEELEKRLKAQNFLNVYACIASCEVEDEYLTHGSVKFHKKMGYKEVSYLKKCGYKFNRWYDLVTMEKILGEHTANPKEILPPQ